MADDKKTLVDEGTEFRGSLSSKCPVVVRGAVDGELKAPSLRVSESGSVNGKVQVGELASEGHLAGEFDADVVKLSGVVKDGTVVRAKTLEVQNGVDDPAKMRVVFGDVTLEVGDINAAEPPPSPAAGGKRPRRE
jgi:cytoskeletal protein CcmA (bactofilin family)